MATNGKGLITIIGSPRTFFEYENFESNGDASFESTTKYGDSWYIIADSSEATGSSVFSNSAYNQLLLKNSLI